VPLQQRVAVLRPRLARQPLDRGEPVLEQRLAVLARVQPGNPVVLRVVDEEAEAGVRERERVGRAEQGRGHVVEDAEERRGTTQGGLGLEVGGERVGEGGQDVLLRPGGKDGQREAHACE
jgi:hypothetical protein